MTNSTIIPAAPGFYVLSPVTGTGELTHDDVVIAWCVKDGAPLDGLLCYPVTPAGENRDAEYFLHPDGRVSCPFYQWWASLTEANRPEHCAHRVEIERRGNEALARAAARLPLPGVTP
ncbi:MAG TPA: hypothetical protein PK743_01495 [Luteimonas sp.]|mgnify:CR=1 FL=1|nr:hypothetical protein [Luteimonas sp.]